MYLQIAFVTYSFVTRFCRRITNRRNIVSRNISHVTQKKYIRLIISKLHLKFRVASKKFFGALMLIHKFSGGYAIKLLKHRRERC
jgi:hypothetical protein